MWRAARIRAANFPAFELWSPVGWAIARFFELVGMSTSAASTLHTVTWWVHALLALAFVAYLPYSKSMHMLADGVNLLAHDRDATRALPAPVPDAGHAGYTKIEDFTWKELLDFDSCTKCGRCHEVCPARTAGAPLSPRDLILDLRQWVDVNSGGLALLDREERPAMPGADAAIAGDVIKARTLVVVHDLHGMCGDLSGRHRACAHDCPASAHPGRRGHHGLDPAAGAAEPGRPGQLLR